MDFSNLVARIEPKLRRLAVILNDSSVNPSLRQTAHRSVLETIGQLVYDKAYDMTAWDYDIADTLGRIFDRDIATGLARNLSDSIATGDRVPVNDQLGTYTNKAALAAQSDASMTAQQLGKYTVLKVRLGPKKDCDWCKARAARSPIYNPTPIDFGRHGGCDCKLEAQGFRSRNGEVKNYRPRIQT